MSPVLQTTLLKIDTASRFQFAVDHAVSALRDGQAVALPTETVYGLAVNALDADAVARLFLIKGRPPRNPVIVHVAGLDLVRRCVAHWPAVATDLARAFWPGPITLVLPKAASIPAQVTAGGPTVGVRWPDHPFVQAVIQACNFPLAAPSANASTRTSPTRAEHVLASLAGRIPLIIDGGPCPVGIESTVLDLTQSPWRVLRPGMISEEAIAKVAGASTRPHPNPEPTPTILASPGMLDRHYAPSTPLRVLEWTDDEHLASQVADILATPPSSNPGFAPWPVCVLAHTHIPNATHYRRVAALPNNPSGFAYSLYAELHACDQTNASLILVERVPPTPEWNGIADRLSRASH